MATERPYLFKKKKSVQKKCGWFFFFFSETSNSWQHLCVCVREWHVNAWRKHTLKMQSLSHLLSGYENGGKKGISWLHTAPFWKEEEVKTWHHFYTPFAIFWKLIHIKNFIRKAFSHSLTFFLLICFPQLIFTTTLCGQNHPHFIDEEGWVFRDHGQVKAWARCRWALYPSQPNSKVCVVPTHQSCGKGKHWTHVASGISSEFISVKWTLKNFHYKNHLKCLSSHS